MSRVAETQHCVKNIAIEQSARQSDAIRALIGQGHSDQAIVQLTGSQRDYVRAVRGRMRRKLGADAVPIRGRFPSHRTKPPPGNTPAELRQLARTLYRWRQEGRFEP